MGGNLPPALTLTSIVNTFPRSVLVSYGSPVYRPQQPHLPVLVMPNRGVALAGGNDFNIL
jgi:hypothetical protein